MHFWTWFEVTNNSAPLDSRPSHVSGCLDAQRANRVGGFAGGALRPHGASNFSELTGGSQFPYDWNRIEVGTMASTAMANSGVASAALTAKVRRMIWRWWRRGGTKVVTGASAGDDPSCRVELADRIAAQLRTVG